MPGMDQTGPLGQGPLTGRGLGPCGAGFRTGFNRGRGRGLGRGFGFGRGFALAGQPVQQVAFSEADEKKILEQELKELDLDRKEIEKRLKELKA
ncbi:MAG TPA: DUF5320 domain-containing protein [Candidatus Nanoarchaeia archaeon]|nr:DUF5320 domain-containing protein [Candidatus Nanoarchaeia archaeon]